MIYFLLVRVCVSSYVFFNVFFYILLKSLNGIATNNVTMLKLIISFCVRTCVCMCVTLFLTIGKSRIVSYFQFILVSFNYSHLNAVMATLLSCKPTIYMRKIRDSVTCFVRQGHVLCRFSLISSKNCLKYIEFIFFSLS